MADANKRKQGPGDDRDNKFGKKSKVRFILTTRKRDHEDAMTSHSFKTYWNSISSGRQFLSFEERQRRVSEQFSNKIAGRSSRQMADSSTGQKGWKASPRRED